MGWSRVLAPGQLARAHVHDVETDASSIIHVDQTVLLEAPNWTSGGDLILNGDGILWRLPALDRPGQRACRFIRWPELNNDHVLAPQDDTIFLSANDGHLYAASLTDGSTRRITPSDAEHFHFLHGVSPDGAHLAYVALNPDEGWDSGTLRLIDANGQRDVALTAGAGPDDGPQYSPDGHWIYFNTERFRDVPGHAQIARIRHDGTELRQLTFDERVNWFPHFDPTGQRAVYLSFPPGTEGHLRTLWSSFVSWRTHRTRRPGPGLASWLGSSEGRARSTSTAGHLTAHASPTSITPSTRQTRTRGPRKRICPDRNTRGRRCRGLIWSVP